MAYFILFLQVRKAYKKLMVDLVKLLGDVPNAEAMMMEIYDFEETLAKVTRTYFLALIFWMHFQMQMHDTLNARNEL